MREQPHEAILNTVEPKAAVEQHLTRQIELLRDLANFGSNLVIRAFSSSPLGMADLVACGVMLKQIVAMVDAVEVLLSEGCTHAAFLQARTAFEAAIYLEWILFADSDLRARRFIVANYRDERTWNERVIPGTTAEAVFSDITRDLKLNLHAERPTLAADAKCRTEEIDRILAQPDLREVDAEFTAARKKAKYDPDWYSLNGGPKTIRQVAKQVDCLVEYDFFYSKGSSVAHTGSYRDHLAFVGGKVIFKPIRNLAESHVLVSFLTKTCFRAYRKVLERYRPAELPALKKKYLEDWQDAFKKQPQFNYTYSGK